MRIFREYAKRHELPRPVLPVPCSYTATGVSGKTVMIVVHTIPLSDDVLVKYWDLTPTGDVSPLPPCEEVRMTKEDVLVGNFVPENYSADVEDEPVIPARLTAGRQPVGEDDYNAYFDAVGNPSGDSKVKFKRLWDRFIDYYRSELPPGYGRYPLAVQQAIVADGHRKLWGYWGFWRLHMIDSVT